MKKKKWLLAALLTACLCGPGCGLSHAKGRGGTDGERLEISFSFRRGGIASGQYAVWIEDESGRLVRTLFVTSFTANGGYAYRKDAVPTWVGKAKPAGMASARIDAVSGATPRNGTVHYVWDGTDDEGRPVPAGTYRLFVEGTLYWSSRVFYCGTVQWGRREQTSIPLTPRYYNASSTNREMITD